MDVRLAPYRREPLAHAREYHPDQSRSKEIPCLRSRQSFDGRDERGSRPPFWRRPGDEGPSARSQARTIPLRTASAICGARRVAAPARLLVDAGPLSAPSDRRDRWHRRALAFFGAFHGAPVTTWPVSTEAGHFIGRKAPDLLELVDAGRIEISGARGATGRIATHLPTYADLPMDLADATLVAAAEQSGLADALMRDRHFHAYRIRARGRFSVWAT